MAGTRPSKSSGDVPCDLGNPRARSLKAPDAADPNDRAFRLVRCTGTFLIICSVRARRTNVASLSQITANGVSVTEALDLCNATMKRRAMYARIARWRKRLQQAREDEQVAESAVLQLLKGEARGVATTPSKQPSSPSPPSPGETASSFFASKRKPSPIKRKRASLTILGGLLAKNSATSKKTRTKAQESAITNLPGWMNKEATATTMFGRKKRSRKDKSKDDFAFKIDKEYRERKFKSVWKMATTQLQENNCGPNKGKKGYGARAVAQQYNHLLVSPGDRTIKHVSLTTQVAMGEFGVSPKKMGRPPKIPDALKKAAALQTVLLQVNGESEASKSKLMATSHALVMKTKWEGTFSHEYLFNAARAKYPEIMNPVTAKSHKDRRVDWLSYKNIKD